MALPGITATALQKGNEQFFCDPCGNYGKTVLIPCGSDAAKVDDVNYWAVPAKDEYMEGFRYEIADEPPTFDSIQVFKLTSLQNADYWWIIGTREEYFVACSACCGPSPIPSIATDDRVIFAPTQYTCSVDGTNYDANFALPVLLAGQHYEIAGSLNGEALTPAPTNNYASVAALLSWLNTNWSEAGVWSSVNTPISIRARLATGPNWVGFYACAVDNA